MFFSFIKKLVILLVCIYCIFFKITLNAKEQNINIKYKTNFTNKNIIESVYNRPYNAFDNHIEYKFIKSSLITMAGASVIGAGILYLLPESFTNWDKDDTSNIFKKWKDNVSEGPVRDSDDFFLNYVTHPYWGAVYYMSARSAGANIFYSFLYSTMLSTFFWEYGIEAFAEVPSKQDLIITPVIGSIFGELFYITKRHIVDNNYSLFSSQRLGKFTIFLIDPITEISKIFLKDEKKYKKNQDVALFSYPFINEHGNFGYNIIFSYKF